jgi:hypothetical protein
MIGTKSCDQVGYIAYYLNQDFDNVKILQLELTPAVNFDSRNFNGHCPISSSSMAGGGGFHRTKYGIKAYAPPKHERTRNGQTGTLLFELKSK